MNNRLALLIPLLSFTLLACGEEAGDSADRQQADTRVATIVQREGGEASGVLDRYDLASDDPDVLGLPAQLEEVSGLATSADGRLFAHNDERGVVYTISTRSGEASSLFSVGSITLSEDLEGIAIIGERFFLVNSKGDLFEFREGIEGGVVDFTLHETDLSGKYDVEGLCYDPQTDALLLACKEYPGDELDEKDHRAVYSLSLATMTIDPSPRFVLPIDELEERLDIKKFRPSAIERDSRTGHFLILSGNDPAIIEIDRSGTIVAAHPLSKKIHPQPEGLAFGRNGELLIGNEGGRLVRYRSRRAVD